MNIQEYISSGIVESYVLGLAEQEERAEFERMCAAHGEVRAARDAFEIQVEKQAIMNAIAPPMHLKGKIFAELEIESGSSSLTVPVINKIGDNNTGRGDYNKAVTTINWMRYLIAASLILLVGSTALNVFYFRQYKEVSARYAALQANNEQLTAGNQVIQAKLQSYETDMAIIKDPNMAVVKMLEAPKSPAPGSLATVYWNTLTKDVYLLVNSMPQPASDKQYQLWALVDDKPVDAGVFDNSTGKYLVKMKNTPKAQKFAITLEKRGGSIAPTMEQLYVLGNVKT